MIDETFSPQCKLCGDTYEDGRYRLGIVFCMSCGDELAHKVVRCVVPQNKSNYMLVTDLSLLKQLNPKRTT